MSECEHKDTDIVLKKTGRYETIYLFDKISS